MGSRKTSGSRKILAGLAAFLLVCVAAGCRSRGKLVRIAVAVPLTGDLGSEGESLRRAVTLAVEQANEAKRLPFRVEVAAFDDRADPAEAYNVANLIVDDPRIMAVVGHYSSDCSERAAPVYARASLPMITPASTYPGITLAQLRPDWPGARVVFRLVPTDDVQGDFAAQFMRGRLRQRRVAVLHDDTLYGRGLAERFKKTFLRLGGQIVAEAAVKVGARHPQEAMGLLRSGNPQGVFFGGRYPEAGLILEGMRRLGIKLLFCSGDGARTPGLFDVAGSAADGAYLTMAGAPVETLAAAQDFVAAYRARWRGAGDGPRPFDHYGYEAAQIVLDALASAGPDRARLVDAIHGVRHQGLLGVTSFDEKGDVRDTTIAMTRARAADRSFPVVP
jgi:branched-chain amino acid transport system substrate-binding protein